MIPTPTTVRARQVAAAMLQDLHQLTAHANSLLFYGRPADAHLNLPELTAEDLQGALGAAGPQLDKLLEGLNR